MLRDFRAGSRVSLLNQPINDEALIFGNELGELTESRGARRLDTFLDTLHGDIFI